MLEELLRLRLEFYRSNCEKEPSVVYIDKVSLSKAMLEDLNSCSHPFEFVQNELRFMGIPVFPVFPYGKMEKHLAIH